MTKDDMKKLFLALTMLPMLVQGQTLEECQQAAEKNYPLIQQYGLIEKTTQLIGCRRCRHPHKPRIRVM